MNRLWYKSPAKDWNEALPVGNGRIGGMVFGNPGHEIIQLNEESIWSGPYRDRNNYSCKENLEKVRELINQGRFEEAQELGFESMTGSPSQQAVYQTAGDLHIDYYTAEKNGLSGPLPDRKGVFDGATGYVRDLNLDTAIATTSFSKETKVPSTAIFSRNSHGSSIEYRREVFVSAAADVMVIHISASTPKSVYFRAHLDRGDFTGNLHSMNGDTIAMDATNCIPFCVMAMATTSNGTVQTRGNFLIVEGADEVTLYVDIQTGLYDQIKTNLDKIASNVNAIIRTYNNVKTNAGNGIMARVNTYLNNATNDLYARFEGKPAYRLTEPMLLFESNYGINRLEANMTIKGNNLPMTFIMTSLTEEYIVPVYMKYVALLVGGKVQQSYLLPGSEKIISLTVPNEPCEIVYQAADFYGNVVTKRYPLNR